MSVEASPFLPENPDISTLFEEKLRYEVIDHFNLGQSTTIYQVSILGVHACQRNLTTRPKSKAAQHQLQTGVPYPAGIQISYRQKDLCHTIKVGPGVFQV
jgi:hypothetical protein